jgi:hypothetical protein
VLTQIAKEKQRVACRSVISRSLNHPLVFIEIFSGSGHLASAIKGLGCLAIMWDISLGMHFDLTLRNNQSFLRGLLMGHVVWGIHMGTPCTSFSRARRGKPPPIRDNCHVMGLLVVSEKDARKIKDGNCLMIFSFGILSLCHRLLLPCTIENPTTSMLWITPHAIRASHLEHYTQAVTEFCMFGKPWRKSTKVVGVHIGLRKFDDFRCVNKPAGLCKRTGCPHLVLSGQDPDIPGQFLTLTAQPYPRGFCRVLATAFKNASTCKTGLQLSKLIYRP